MCWNSLRCPLWFAFFLHPLFCIIISFYSQSARELPLPAWEAQLSHFTRISHPDIRCMDVLWTHDPKCTTSATTFGSQSHLIKPPEKNNKHVHANTKRIVLCGQLTGTTRHEVCWQNPHKCCNYTRTPDRAIFMQHVFNKSTRDSDLQYKVTRSRLQRKFKYLKKIQQLKTLYISTD